MGGLGSGRHWHYGSKSTVNSYCNIDIRKWRREDLLTPGTTFITRWLRDGETTNSIQILVAEKCVILSYECKNSEKTKNMEYSISLEWTSCNLGGMRPWFQCPARNCQRRVAVLYGGSIFACRQCYQLAYSSQNENTCDRTIRKAEKIRQRMEWEPGILNGEGLKPKGMHWKTFERLCFIHNELVSLSVKEASLRFGINIFDLQYL